MKTMLKLTVITGFLMLTGCAVNPASLKNADNTECQTNLKKALGTILLEEEGDSKSSMERQLMMSIATSMVAEKAVSELANLSEKPYSFGFPFSGTTYQFLFGESSGTCVLKLFQKSSGSGNYSNTITYINTKTVAGCQCQK